jgi:orotidine-5'-phosphate decarboxylase
VQLQPGRPALQLPLSEVEPKKGSPPLSPKIVYALDVPSLDEARRAALAVGDAVGMLKVGLELFVRAGPGAAAVGEATARPVFLDLKLCDIPETVERAVAAAAATGARVLTVHASGGAAMLRRAAERASKEGTGLEIAAVTVLTSLDDADLASLGCEASALRQAGRLARLAFDQGVRSFVCSPREAASVRALLGPDVTLYTPGVRPSASATGGRDDQKRVMTAADAVASGADWLVVGRPIRDAADPLAAARALGREIEAARASRRP